MKKILIAILTLIASSVVVAQTQTDRMYDITSSGLMYKFEKSNPAAQGVNRGDVLVGEMVLSFEGDTLMSNMGDPQRIIQVGERSFAGDLSDGLLMMHKGDKAVFGVSADEMAKYLDESQMPKKYKKGSGMRFFYAVTIEDILTPQDIAVEQEVYLAEMSQRKAEEPSLIERYINEHPANWVQTKEGVYVNVKKEGGGKAVKKGKMVKADFECRTLEGQLFDTSKKEVAQKEGGLVEGREYGALNYKVGELAMIEGWEKGIEGQKKGSELTLVVPSNMAYGAQGMGTKLMPYTPIVIDITILEVK